MPDKYKSFAALAAGEGYGKDYRIVIKARASMVAVIAPHGGTIEPTTSELAGAIAGDTWSLYCFEGLISKRKHGDLHITSELFDEPQGRALVQGAQFVVAIHGRADTGDEITWLGGLDDTLVGLLGDALRHANFQAKIAVGALAGRTRGNICNDGKRGAGAQLELPRTLRDRLAATPESMGAFAAAVQSAIEERVAAISR